MNQCVEGGGVGEVGGGGVLPVNTTTSDHTCCSITLTAHMARTGIHVQTCAL